jgi:hypothetical protein
MITGGTALKPSATERYDCGQVSPAIREIIGKEKQP